jgi:hypothetical protein
MERHCRDIEEAIEKSEFHDGTKIDIDTLGAVVESYGKTVIWLNIMVVYMQVVTLL